MLKLIELTQAVFGIAMRTFFNLLHITFVIKNYPNKKAFLKNEAFIFLPQRSSIFPETESR